jgi:hypothetical protein
VAIIAGVIAIFFFVSLVVNLAQAQLFTATDDNIGQFLRFLADQTKIQHTTRL